MKKTKSFNIDKKLFVQAFKQVKQNKGACGVDGITIKDFEDKISNNLYKLWNRTSSGSYFPPPVLQVKIPKKDGGERNLGIPTVGDRVVQTLVKNILEPDFEKIFHEDSYGFRPNKSAHDALDKTIQRCNGKNWVLDVDIKNFFDSIPHDLLMKAVRFHTDCKWIIMLIERWLKAPVQLEDGSIVERIKGTPQGGVISPLLANLFLHYAFDHWMGSNHTHISFERYADDIICHLDSKIQAEWFHKELSKRFSEMGLELHPIKTKIAYCKDSRRRDSYPIISFDFLGFTFKPRKCKNSRTSEYYSYFSPSISLGSIKKIKNVIKSWVLKNRIAYDFYSLSVVLNPIIRGWINYFGKYRKSGMSDLWRYLHDRIVSWIRRKYKRHDSTYGRAYKFLKTMMKAKPTLFAHWKRC
ncbi:MAG: group II intron reverse transcriptase/maturase [Candidatus Cloacimonadota bacterium]|nr:MAG: group II intron reverse transcriptase/maturase [Candidatus Cloacimonadota bacterium]